MKAHYSYLILSILIFSCDFNPAADLDWNPLDVRIWNFYSGKVKVVDVNSEICYKAMLTMDGETVKHYSDLQTGIITVSHSEKAKEDKPVYIYLPAKVYMNRFDVTKFKSADIKFGPTNNPPTIIVQFDIPK